MYQSRPVHDVIARRTLRLKYALFEKGTSKGGGPTTEM